MQSFILLKLKFMQTQIYELVVELQHKICQTHAESVRLSHWAREQSRINNLLLQNASASSLPSVQSFVPSQVYFPSIQTSSVLCVHASDPLTHLNSPCWQGAERLKLLFVKLMVPSHQMLLSRRAFNFHTSNIKRIKSSVSNWIT